MNTKRVFWGFYSLDYKATEEFLEEMAQKGWMLEKIGRTIAKFKKIEPQKLFFYVDIFEGGGPFKSENTYEAKEYRDEFQSQGWKFITSQDYLQFFCSEVNNKDSIIKDEKVEQKKIESTLWKMEQLNLFLILILSFIVYSRLLPLTPVNFVSSMGIAVVLLFPILFLSVAFSTIYGMTQILKARKNIKNGLETKKPTLKNAINRRFLFNFPALIILGIFLISLISDSLFMSNIVLFSLAPPVVGMTIGFFLRYFIKKANNQNHIMLYVGGAIIIIVISISTINMTFLNNDLVSSNNIENIPNDYPFLNIQELTDESEVRELISKEFNHSMSIIVPKYYNYREIRESTGMNIKYYEAVNPYFAKAIFNTSIEEIRRGIKWKRMYLFSENVNEENEMRKLWNVDNFAITEGRNEAIIQKDKVVVHISGSIDFDDIETKKLIINTFFDFN